METTKTPTMIFDKVVALACLLLILFAVVTVATHLSTVVNRYRDAWWHIASADEYQRTGVFAKDPFYSQAPPFVPFGLMEVATAKLSSVTGQPIREAFLLLYLLNTLVFLAGGFLSGYLIFRTFTAGLVSSVATSLFLVAEWPFAGGFPFVTAVGLLGFFSTSLWNWSSCSTCDSASSARAGAALSPSLTHYWGGAWRGLALGLIFDLHVFAGFFGVLLVASTALAQFSGCLLRRDSRRMRTVLAGYAVVCGGFLATAWPWLHLQWQARPYLDNPHRLLRMASLPEYLHAMLIGAALVLLHVTFSWYRRQPRLLGTPHLGLAAATLILATPFSRQIIGDHSMPAMADRLPLLFPFGAVCAAVYAQCAQLLRGDVRSRNAGVWLVVLALLVASPITYRRARVCVNVLRRSGAEYAQHPYGFLTADLGSGWQGKVILSDPYTSFFARGLVGPYVVGTVMGQSSQAVDDLAKDEVARRALLDGPRHLDGLRVDAVVIEKSNRGFLEEDPFTRSFAAISPEQVVDVWTNSGWRIARETRHIILLCPPAP